MLVRCRLLTTPETEHILNIVAHWCSINAGDESFARTKMINHGSKNCILLTEYQIVAV